MIGIYILMLELFLMILIYAFHYKIQEWIRRL